MQTLHCLRQPVCCTQSFCTLKEFYILEILRIRGLAAQILVSCVIQTFAVIKQEYEICSLKTAFYQTQTEEYVNLLN